MTAVRWMVLRDRSPFAVGEELGLVTAPDRAAAERLGADTYGAPVVVRAAMSLEVEAREPLMPLPTRRKRYDRARQARPHAALRTGAQPMAPLELPIDRASPPPAPGPRRRHP